MLQKQLLMQHWGCSAGSTEAQVYLCLVAFWWGLLCLLVELVQVLLYLLSGPGVDVCVSVVKQHLCCFRQPLKVNTAHHFDHQSPEGVAVTAMLCNVSVSDNARQSSIATVHSIRVVRKCPDDCAGR